MTRLTPTKGLRLWQQLQVRQLMQYVAPPADPFSVTSSNLHLYEPATAPHFRQRRQQMDQQESLQFSRFGPMRRRAAQRQAPYDSTAPAADHIQVNMTLLPNSLAKPSQSLTLVVTTCQKVGVSMKKATSSWTQRTTTTTRRFVLGAS